MKSRTHTHTRTYTHLKDNRLFSLSQENSFVVHDAVNTKSTEHCKHLHVYITHILWCKQTTVDLGSVKCETTFNLKKIMLCKCKLICQKLGYFMLNVLRGINSFIPNVQGGKRKERLKAAICSYANTFGYVQCYFWYSSTHDYIGRTCLFHLCSLNFCDQCKKSCLFVSTVPSHSLITNVT